MSPSPRGLFARARRGPSAQQGFTLVEVIVALMIFGVMAAAVVPMLVSAARLAATAKLSTQAKQLSVERVESMRNLPYYVAFDNGQYRDVLDIYFKDLVAAGVLYANDPCTARGYIAASRTYRCTINPITGYPKFRQQVDVQFLTAARVLVGPRATYNSRVTNQDVPASGLLGVTVTTTWDAPSGAKSSVLRTEIANVTSAARRIVSQAGATAMEISSTLSSGQIVQFQAGLFNASGALSTAASASHTTVGAQANYLSGNSVQGATASASAPADENPGTSSTGGRELESGSCYPVCFGDTSVTGDVNARVSTGMPLVSTSSSMARGLLERSDVNNVGGVSYSNVTGDEADDSLTLHPTLPMVFFTDGSTSSTVAEAAGYLTATKNGNSVRAYASASTRRLRILPTTFAPDGLIKVRLNSSSIDCNNIGGAGSVTTAWDAEVDVFSSTAPGGYVSYQLTSSSAVTLPAPSDIDVLPGLPLSTWIDSWAGMSNAWATTESTGTLARGSAPAVVSITTKPTRGVADPASALGIEVGSLTCTAEDLR